MPIVSAKRAVVGSAGRHAQTEAAAAGGQAAGAAGLKRSVVNNRFGEVCAGLSPVAADEFKRIVRLPAAAGDFGCRGLEGGRGRQAGSVLIPNGPGRAVEAGDRADKPITGSRAGAVACDGPAPGPIGILDHRTVLRELGRGLTMERLDFRDGRGGMPADGRQAAG